MSNFNKLYTIIFITNIIRDIIYLGDKMKNKNSDSILDNYLKNSKLTKWLKKYVKFFVTILIYFMYQTNFILVFLENIGLDYNKIPKGPRICLYTITDLIYLFIIIFMFRKEIKQGINDLKQNFLDRTLSGLQCWLIGSAIMTISSLIIRLITKQDISNNEQLVRDSIALAPLYMLFTCSIMAPFFEEMIFRRTISAFIKNKWIYIISSGVIFGLLHIIGSYKGPLDFLYIIPYGSMGCLFAYLYRKTNNITLPIIIHMLHNTILVIGQIIGG